MIKWIAVVFVILLLLFLAENYRELHSFRMTHYTVSSPKLSKECEEKCVIFLSDLHNHLYGEKNVELLRAIRKEQPSWILIGGDMPVGKRGITFRNAAEFVNNLSEICPVYYANGNHEQRMKENTEKYGDMFRRYRKALSGGDIVFLENESADATIAGTDFRISGLELPLESYGKWKSYPVSASDVEERLGKCDNHHYHILMAHNPEYADAYLKWGADLILCGHLHGGLVCFPGGKSIITPQFHLFPRYAGEMTQEDGQAVVVSRGLGTHTFHIRLFNEAEAVAIHFKSERG